MVSEQRNTPPPTRIPQATDESIHMKKKAWVFGDLVVGPDGEVDFGDSYVSGTTTELDSTILVASGRNVRVARSRQDRLRRVKV
jgi:hypothetical protein